MFLSFRNEIIQHSIPVNSTTRGFYGIRLSSVGNEYVIQKIAKIIPQQDGSKIINIPKFICSNCFSFPMEIQSIYYDSIFFQ
jgi:hypothetical protein